jgi:hypothetical protein
LKALHDGFKGQLPKIIRQLLQFLIAGRSEELLPDGAVPRRPVRQRRRVRF